jgi:hypothetical protein
MAGVWSDLGVAAKNDATTGRHAFPSMKLRLYSNNLTPDNTKVVGDFTEATFAGYAAVSLNFSADAVVTAHVANDSADAVTFTITAGTQNIYGWYVTNAAGTVLYFSQRDANAPVGMSSAGLNTYTITVTLSDKDIAT